LGRTTIRNTVSVFSSAVARAARHVPEIRFGLHWLDIALELTKRVVESRVSSAQERSADQPQDATCRSQNATY
jgi:hypothetical protein